MHILYYGISKLWIASTSYRKDGDYVAVTQTFRLTERSDICVFTSDSEVIQRINEHNICILRLRKSGSVVKYWWGERSCNATSHKHLRRS